VKYNESHSGPVTNGTLRAPDEPFPKKRKLEEDNLAVRAHASLAFQAKDISFSIPQRKKLHLNVVWTAAGGYVFQGRNTTKDEVEFEASAGSFSAFTPRLVLVWHSNSEQLIFSDYRYQRKRRSSTITACYVQMGSPLCLPSMMAH
jgi:hypothetical protein